MLQHSQRAFPIPPIPKKPLQMSCILLEIALSLTLKQCTMYVNGRAKAEALALWPLDGLDEVGLSATSAPQVMHIQWCLLENSRTLMQAFVAVEKVAGHADLTWKMPNSQVLLCLGSLIQN
jgi:hypothetical protein